MSCHVRKSRKMLYAGTMLSDYTDYRVCSEAACCQTLVEGPIWSW